MCNQGVAVPIVTGMRKNKKKIPQPDVTLAIAVGQQQPVQFTGPQIVAVPNEPSATVNDAAVEDGDAAVAAVSFDALSDPDPAYRHSKERAVACDSIAATLGLGYLSSTFEVTMADAGVPAEQMAYSEIPDGDIDFALVQSLDARFLGLPVAGEDIFEALVAQFGFEPVYVAPAQAPQDVVALQAVPAATDEPAPVTETVEEVPEAVETPTAEATEATILTEAAEPIAEVTTVEDDVLAETKTVETGETGENGENVTHVGAEGETAQVEVVEAGVFVAPAFPSDKFSETEPAAEDAAKVAVVADVSDVPDVSDVSGEAVEAEPVWEETEAAPVTQAEQEALATLLEDLRDFSALPMTPPMPVFETVEAEQR